MPSSPCVWHAYPSVVGKRESCLCSGAQARATRILSRGVKWATSMAWITANWSRNVERVLATSLSRNVENMRKRKSNVEQKTAGLTHRLCVAVEILEIFRSYPIYISLCNLINCDLFRIQELYRKWATNGQYSTNIEENAWHLKPK